MSIFLILHNNLQLYKNMKYNIKLVHVTTFNVFVILFVCNRVQA